MIDRIQNLPENVIGFTATGKITAGDYESVLIPAIEAELEKHEKIHLLYQMGPEFSGFSAGAMWEDAKVGIKHLTAWEKVAVVTDVDWIRGSFTLFRFAMPGQVKIFSNNQLDDAKEWIAS